MDDTLAETLIGDVERAGDTEQRDKAFARSIVAMIKCQNKTGLRVKQMMEIVLEESALRKQREAVELASRNGLRTGFRTAVGLLKMLGLLGGGATLLKAVELMCH